MFAVNLCLKLLAELPRSLPADLLVWKFPRFQSIVHCSYSVGKPPSHQATGEVMMLKLHNATIELRSISNVDAEPIIFALAECKIRPVLTSRGPFGMGIQIDSSK